MKNIAILLQISAITGLAITSLAFLESNTITTYESVASDPDFRVGAIQIPEGFKVGNCTSLKVWISNPTPAVVDTVIKVTLYVSQRGQEAVTYTRPLLGISAKSKAFVWFNNVSVNGKGQAKVEATVNADKKIKESNYSNNKKLIYPKPTTGC